MNIDLDKKNQELLKEIESLTAKNNQMQASLDTNSAEKLEEMIKERIEVALKEQKLQMEQSEKDKLNRLVEKITQIEQGMEEKDAELLKNEENMLTLTEEISSLKTRIEELEGEDELNKIKIQEM